MHIGWVLIIAIVVVHIVMIPLIWLIPTHRITIPPGARITLPAKGTTPVEPGLSPANIRCCCGAGTNCIHF